MEVSISPIIKDSDYTDDEAKFLKNSRNIGFFSYKMGGRAYSPPSSRSCHAPIVGGEIKKITQVSTAFHEKAEGMDALKKFLFWDKGPFKDLMSIAPDKWTFIVKDGKVHGISIPDEVMAYKPYALVYAFLICTRLGAENTHLPKSFKKLVELGCDPALSFIAAMLLNWDGQHFQVGATYWHGSHQIFNDLGGPQYSKQGDVVNKCAIDYLRFKNGEHHKDLGNVTYYCNKIWGFKEENFPDTFRSTRAFMWAGYSETLKTRFTTISGISEENMVRAMKDFEKFMMQRYT